MLWLASKLWPGAGVQRVRTARALLLALCAVLPAPTFAAGNDGGGLWPWASQSAPKPPPIPPFELPTFGGEAGEYKGQRPAWVKAPRVDGDAVFRAVIACYPARSRWQIDVDLQAAVRNTGAVDVSGTTIGRSMVGIVARMPIYSDTEMDRERQREYQRRTDTAKTVADFLGQIAKRNAAVRSLALAATMEQRAQVRVREGIADADEQTKWLDKVIGAENDLMTTESAVQEARLKLVAQCRDDVADSVNAYLSELSQLPDAGKVGAGGTAVKR